MFVEVLLRFFYCFFFYLLQRSLLLSIIPAHIVNKIEHDVRSRLEHKMAKRRASQNPHYGA